MWKAWFKLAILLLLINGGSTITSGEARCPFDDFPNFFPNFYFVYEVKVGDTLSEIAQRYQVSVSGLLWANNLSSDRLVRAGSELIIPQKLFESIPDFNKEINLVEQDNFQLSLGVFPLRHYQQLPAVNIDSDQVILYQIKRGDTLYDLARKFNTQVAVIQALNELPSPQIRIGQRIYLPIDNLTPREALERLISDDELELLARTIHAEARGEPFIGQVAVGAVIINRLLDSSFPDTFYGVIYAPQQFSCVLDGQINLQPNQTSFEAAKAALGGLDPTSGALYYYNPRTATQTHWLVTREIAVIIGNHKFLY